jgi:hypothetical protein
MSADTLLTHAAYYLRLHRWEPDAILILTHAQAEVRFISGRVRFLDR